MTNEFATGIGKATYKDCVFIEEEGNEYTISDSFLDVINKFARNILIPLSDFKRFVAKEDFSLEAINVKR